MDPPELWLSNLTFGSQAALAESHFSQTLMIALLVIFYCYSFNHRVPGWIAIMLAPAMGFIQYIAIKNFNV